MTKLKKCHKTYWRKAGRSWWPKVLIKRRTRFPLYVILLFIVVQWFINFHRSEMTNYAKERFSKFRAITTKMHRLRYQLQMLSFRFTFREHVTAVTLRETHHESTKLRTTFIRAKVENQDRSRKWPVVISIGCSLKNLAYFLESFRKALVGSTTTVICIFVFTCGEATRQQDVTSINMINELDVCLPFKWNVSEPFPEINLSHGNRHPRIEQLQKPKLQWWNFMSEFFRLGIVEGLLFDGILKAFSHDVLFIDSNVVLSPDFLQVARYASEMKASLSNIIQLSLGNWDGQNLINAHPDTFAVRRSRELHAFAYGMNISNWKTLSNLQQSFLEDLNPDWTESVGEVLSKKSGGFGIQTIVPTLSRYWLMTSAKASQFEEKGDTTQVYESSTEDPRFPPWLISPRLISVNYSTLNYGVRDCLGFLCKKDHTLNDGPTKNAICHCSFWIWENTKKPWLPRCFPQGNDDCLDSY